MQHSLVHQRSNGATFSVTLDNGVAAVEDARVNVATVKNGGVYCVQWGDRQVPVKVESDGINAITLWINGYAYDYDVFTQRHGELLAILRASPVAKNRSVKLMSPMPGLLKAVHVQNGEPVRKGDILFTLEAMKMENAIKAPASGVVMQCVIDAGKPVDKGTLLCTIEPAQP